MNMAATLLHVNLFAQWPHTPAIKALSEPTAWNRSQIISGDALTDCKWYGGGGGNIANDSHSH